MIVERRKKRYRIFDRPFILFMGPQRSGTSWLDRYLRVRGDICLPSDVKEVFFFDRDFEKGIGSYASHFRPQKDHTLITEISTTSFDHKEAPHRVFDVFGKDIQLVCPLRHPIVRSYSLYLHYLRYGIVSGSLEAACKQQPQILESSRYAENLGRWLKLYSLDNIKIVYQESLEQNQDQFILDVCETLNIPYMAPPEELRERYNVTTYSRSGAIAGFAQRVADWLRRHRLYFIINFVKALGVKRIIFGTEKPDASKTAIPDKDMKFLTEQLGDEIKKLEDLIKKPIDLWK